MQKPDFPGLAETIRRVDAEEQASLPPGLRKPWAWIQPIGIDNLIARLQDARDLAVPDRERENLCSMAATALINYRAHERLSRAHCSITNADADKQIAQAIARADAKLKGNHGI